MQSNLLTTRDVAERIGATEAIVRYLAHTKILKPFVIHARCWRFDREQVDEAVEKYGLAVQPTEYVNNN